MRIVYLGFNSFKGHKRGVENVIDFQMNSYPFDIIYYLHLGEKKCVSKTGKAISISIKNDFTWPFKLNYLIWKISLRKKVVVHSHNPLLSFFYLKKTDILTVHDALFYQSKVNKHRFSSLFAIIEWLLYFKCKHVHFISQFTKRQSLFSSRKNFSIIGNTSHFEGKFRIENSVKTEDSAKRILCVRSIEPRANFDLVIEVSKLLKNENIIIEVAGKGPLLNYYKTLVERENLQNVNFLGYVEDQKLLRMYNQCDIVLMIADFAEGFGLPIIEGYLFDKPVIASNCCAIPEIIINEKFLFENNLKDLYRKINEVLYLKQKGFIQYYNSRFSNEVIKKQIIELYKKVL